MGLHVHRQRASLSSFGQLQIVAQSKAGMEAWGDMGEGLQKLGPGGRCFGEVLGGVQDKKLVWNPILLLLSRSPWKTFRMFIQMLVLLRAPLNVTGRS